jgi:hypothetical protein
MSDFFGNEQNRVLDVKDRNLDNVVFQYKHPPLTSEWNLINQIGNEKIQNLSKMSLPSGWLHIDDILQDIPESNARTGSIACSSNYTSTSFKLFSLNNNYAIVNGWPLLVQGFGPGSTLDNNVILLDETANQNNNFVFLEVWRKLVGTNDPIYKYGNVNLPYSDNEIEWDAIGAETTKRVQIQYRIRSVKVSGLSDCTKEILDNPGIIPIGGRTNLALLSSFHKFGPSDPGLYVAGDGSDESISYLNTVDGYVYAIPMFIVYRRALSDSRFIATTINNTMVTKEMNLGGYRSDRPDNKIADIIYKDDIVDVRHRVMISDDIKNVVDSTISKLLAGELTTTYKKYTGSSVNACSGGNTLMKLERLNSPSGDNIPDIGVGSNTQNNIFKRRAFCNSEVIHNNNVVQISNIGTWVAGTFTIASRVIFPAGEIVSVEGFYSHTYGTVTGVTTDGINITIAGDSSIVGTNYDLYMGFTFKYHSSSSGFGDIPKEFIEINKNDSLAIATRDNDVYLKFNNAGELLNFGASSGEIGYPGDINMSDRVHFCGGNYTENSDIGHELVLTRTAISGIVNLPLTNYKYNQYYILGVKSVDISPALSDLTSFNVNLTSSSCIITINSLLSQPQHPVIIRLYTGSAVETYSVSESLKMFDMSKQGRGIVDTYEMIMVDATLISGKYTIDTGNKPIIKIATVSSVVGASPIDYILGLPFVFNSSGDMLTIDPGINDMLPVLEGSDYTNDWLPTKIKIEIASYTGPIKVPVFVQSYVASTEMPYNFYYKTIPYQGILNTIDYTPSGYNVYGKIIGEGSAIVSSSGSGAITNYVYNSGLAIFVQNARTISGVNTLWSSYVQVGDYIRKDDTSSYYRIIYVEDELLQISELYKGVVEIGEESGTAYEITRYDIPNSIISNIVDRLPAFSPSLAGDILDYTCYSDALEYSGGPSDIVMVSVRNKLQDPLNAFTNDYILGQGTDAKRGRNDFKMSTGGNPAFKVGEGRPYLTYPETYTVPTGHNKKVYQFYIFMRSGMGYHNNPDLLGKIYLMVIAGETIDSNRNYLNPFSDKDVVDIFELIGRPIIRG